MMKHSHGPDNPDNSRGYEVEDASVREVVWTGVGLAIGTLIVCIAVLGLLRVLQSAEVGARQPITDMAVPSTLPPEPRLQEKPWEEMELFRRREDQMLTTYGWSDQANGKVRIPIDRAMDMVVQRGLPARRQAAEGMGGTQPGNAGSREGANAIAPR
jgi:hypothetical protein